MNRISYSIIQVSLMAFVVFGMATQLVTQASAQINSTELVSTVSALPTTDSAQLVSPDTIFTSTQNNERQQQLETLYQALIEDYGVKLRQFTLNRAQWQSVQTLRSLEEAVAATTAVLIARDKTMITYFELLFEVLEKTPGIELTIKQKSKAAIIARIEWLRQHESLTGTSVDRDSVNRRSDEYTAQFEAMTLEAIKALMLIRLGQLQTTFDRSNGLYARILERNSANPGSSIEEVERARAYAQVDALKTQIQTDLRLARESLDERTAVRGKVQESYTGFITSLEKPYANTSKFLLYLDELARDTW